MDEPIWLFVGIVAAIIGVGIIASIITRANSDGRVQQLQTAVQVLGVQCQQVCGLAENTALSVKVELPADSIITTKADRVCGELTAMNRNSSLPPPVCVRCPCTHDDAVIINTSGASAFYRTHVFACRYTHLDTRNTQYKAMVNCSG